MAQKDRGRSRGPRQVSVTSLLAKTTVEDIFLWIKKAFNDLKRDAEFIKKAFYL